jgi:hypothetical protein
MPGALLPAPGSRRLVVALLCAAFLAFGAMAGFLMTPERPSYDVSGIFLFSSDLFYI